MNHGTNVSPNRIEVANAETSDHKKDRFTQRRACLATKICTDDNQDALLTTRDDQPPLHLLPFRFSSVPSS